MLRAIIQPVRRILFTGIAHDVAMTCFWSSGVGLWCFIMVACRGSLASTKQVCSLIALVIVRVFAKCAHAKHTLDERPGCSQGSSAAPATISEATLAKDIMTWPQGTAAGPSGWTYEHIKAGTSCSEYTSAAVLRFVQDVVQGDLPHLSYPPRCPYAPPFKALWWRPPNRHRASLV
jgi:hypothetical protein